MTASKRLKEIEEYYGPNGFGESDVYIKWLIERVNTLEKRNERLREGLEEIKSYIGKTNLGDCCVQKTCEPYYQDCKKVSGCTYQYGIFRGFNTLGTIAKGALSESD